MMKLTLFKEIKKESGIAMIESSLTIAIICLTVIAAVQSSGKETAKAACTIVRTIGAVESNNYDEYGCPIPGDAPVLDVGDGLNACYVDGKEVDCHELGDVPNFDIN